MKRVCVLLIAWLATSMVPAAVAADVKRPEASSRPNIVVFLVDDMGWQDTSVPFHTQVTPFNQRYRTPNMERLAADGMKFTQAYACSVCSPSRVSLLTGQNAARHRVTNWTLRKNASNDKAHSTLKFPSWNVNGLSPVEGIERTVHAKPLPAYLQEAGYRTIHVGKAHFGAVSTPGADPCNLGFDVNIGGHAAGGTGSFLGQQNFSAAHRKADRIWDVPGLDKYHGQDIFLTEALTREAISALEKATADRQPFFLYMSHYAVHVPFAPDSRFIQRYLDAGLPKTEAMYAAMVEGMDQSLGDIRQALEKQGVADNTIVLFLSDNGGLSAHERGGTRNWHNAPLHSGKGSAYEGGVRVPLLVGWPGVTAAGSVSSQPVIIEDLFSTILEMSGAVDLQKLPPEVDGLSIVPQLRGQHDKRRDDRPLVWHFPNNWGYGGPGIGASSSVRLGDWKLIYYHANRRYELFNLASDLSEKRNLADAEPQRRDHLAELLGKQLAAVQAQMPVVKDTGETVPYPAATGK